MRWWRTPGRSTRSRPRTPDAAIYNRINGLSGDAPSGGAGRQRHV
ncbi:MAG: hypothetical protein M5R40_09920 [Anaerolineae bacterium]|nr:hypothetical protein [Anaerolineae bacterium]